MSIRPSTKSFFDLNKIWYVGRRRLVSHSGMPYDPIKDLGYGCPKVAKMVDFSLSSPLVCM